MCSSVNLVVLVLALCFISKGEAFTAFQHTLLARHCMSCKNSVTLQISTSRELKARAYGGCQSTLTTLMMKEGNNGEGGSGENPSAKYAVGWAVLFVAIFYDRCFSGMHGVCF